MEINLVRLKCDKENSKISYESSKKTITVKRIYRSEKL